jgi:hypothetical protein
MELQGKLKCCEKNLFHCRLVHHKSYTNCCVCGKTGKTDVLGENPVSLPPGPPQILHELWCVSVLMSGNKKKITPKGSFQWNIYTYPREKQQQG